MNASHVSPARMAEMLHVPRARVYWWLNHDMLFAEKRGGTWWIPIDDAMLFMSAYGKKRGTPLSPVTPQASRASYAPYAVTRATKPGPFYVTLSAEAVHHMDAVRRKSCEKLSRQAVIERAVLAYEGGE